MDDDDDLSPAEQMVHDLGLDPALDERIGDDPLLRQARRNVADTARRARELRDVSDDDEAPPA
ncbi:MAG: hypothetical protein ABSD03_10705 [Vulcanimicrobiaceae bacterium]|jgi:hypothetical protein